MRSPGELFDALDVDLGYSPFTNTLPLRRLGLLGAAPGTTQAVAMARVLVPSLQVVAAKPRYTVLGAGRVRYESGTFAADLAIDGEGCATVGWLAKRSYVLLCHVCRCFD